MPLRSILLYSLSLLISSGAFGQSFESVFDSDSTSWRVTERSLINGDLSIGDSYSAQDTLVFDTAYQLIYDGGTLAGGLREAAGNSRLYARGITYYTGIGLAWDTLEYLVYDLRTEPGDSFQAPYYYDDSYIIITDTFTADGKKVLQFGGGYQILEGTGNLLSPLFSSAFQLVSAIEHAGVACHFHGDSLVYRSSGVSEDCEMLLTGIPYLEEMPFVIHDSPGVEMIISIRPGETASLQVLNCSGQLMNTIECKGRSEFVAPSGCVILSIQSGKDTWTQRFWNQ